MDIGPPLPSSQCAGFTVRPASLLLAAVWLAWPVLAAGDNDVAEGRKLFDRYWSEAEAGGRGDGLGPLFNEQTCASCHDGTGPAQVTTLGDDIVAVRGIVARLGRGDGSGDPLYGRQLQPLAVTGHRGEGVVMAALDESGGLRFSATLHDEGLAEGTHISYRLAPSLAGRAGLARISAAAILALADPDDRDGDGISGRPHLMPAGEGTTIGRFGWKAATRGIPEQVAAAFATDMGMSTPLVTDAAGDCTELQVRCREAPAGKNGAGAPEISAESFRQVVAFVTSLPVLPVDQPEPLFVSTGCAACHVPALPDDAGQPVRSFTDLLLHDMGADLDDGVGEPGVSSGEWRTAPLIDLAPRDGRRRYLHDGRAATIAAAIAFHGGEAETARVRFDALAEADRQRLLDYLSGL